MYNVDNNLRRYIETAILPRYDLNKVGGHGREHIETVIERSFELMREFGLKLDPNMVYVIASFHDVGYKADPENHEEVSSSMFLADSTMATFFSDGQRKIIAEAIVDHRASLEYEARSEYGKLVSSADREVSVENMLKRSILYQADKHKDEQPNKLQIIEYSYQKLSSKYGKGGYAKMYFKDKRYLNFVEHMQELLEDKDKFITAEMKIIMEMRGSEDVSSFGFLN